MTTVRCELCKLPWNRCKGHGRATTVDKQVVWTGWGYTDAKAAMNCPKCGVPAGEECVTPAGRKTNGGVPHTERYAALSATGYTANRREVITSHLDIF